MPYERATFACIARLSENDKSGKPENNKSGRMLKLTTDKWLFDLYHPSSLITHRRSLITHQSDDTDDTDDTNDTNDTGNTDDTDDTIATIAFHGGTVVLNQETDVSAVLLSRLRVTTPY